MNQTAEGHACPQMSHPLVFSVSVLLIHLLNEASMALTLDILLPQLFLLVLPLVSLDVVLPVLLPLLGLVHHLPPLALKLICRKLPTSAINEQKHGKQSLLESILCRW